MLIRFAVMIATLVVLFVFGGAPVHAEKRVALVIGNGAYRNVAQLDNPANDARLLADTLRELGFLLVGGDAQLDLDKAAFDRVVQDFGAQLQGADVALFFYAGHGVQVRGTNYLIPVDANPTREADVDFQMLDTNLVMRQMEGAGTRLNLVVLDACRNNPFGGRGLAVGRGRDTETVRLRDASSGLAQMQAPEGTLISFATQPGSVARDGIDGHSPYSKALAATIRKPALGIFDVFNEVGLEVKRATGGAQQPWVSSSPIDGTFYFVPVDAAGVRQAALPPRAPPAPASITAPAITTSDVRFDGIWIAKVACDSKPPVWPAESYQFTANVRDGVFRAHFGVEGMPGSRSFDGKIERDGTTEILVRGFSGDSERDPIHRPRGTEFRWKVAAKFEGSHGIGIRADDRTCNFDFAMLTAPATRSDAHRFDGIWMTSIVCDAVAPDVRGWSTSFVGRVKNSEFHGQTGIEGRAGWTDYYGKIEPDGDVEFRANGSVGDPKKAIGHRPEATPFTWRAAGSFEEAHGSAIRVEGRPCKIDFAKQGDARTAASPTVDVLATRSALPTPASVTSQRFDGRWLTTRTCPRSTDGALGFTQQFIADVKDGSFRGQWGEVGKPNSITYNGRIESDGAALISGKGLTGDPKEAAPGRLPKGSPLALVVTANFWNSHGSGSQRGAGRICNFVFDKKGDGVATASPEK